MNEIDKTPTELLAMLKTDETNMNKIAPGPIMMVNKGNTKGKGKWKGKKKIGSSKLANSKPAFKRASKLAVSVEKANTNGDCHYCKNSGNWKRNCPAYLEDLKKTKSAKASD